MERELSTRICVFMLAAQLTAFASARAQAPQTSGTPPVIGRAKEIALALSSCPPSIASKAAVYVERTRPVKPDIVFFFGSAVAIDVLRFGFPQQHVTS